MADNAKFVITGEFDPSRMIQKINATMNSVKKVIQEGSAEAAKKANQELGKIKTPKPKAGDQEAYKNINKSIKTFNTDIGTAIRRVVLWGAASRLVFESINKIKDATQDVIKLNEILVNIQKIRPSGFSTVMHLA